MIKELDCLRWMTFATIRNPCNVNLVHEFYASMILDVLEEGGPVRLLIAALIAPDYNHSRPDDNLVSCEEEIELRFRYENSGIGLV
ncbi:hypothetical protein Q3G72_034474 [Acer saccharum]|nr:hypothetical protein Q3G72_034474 [Acer saccharum]